MSEAWTLIPSVAVLVTAVLSRRPIESLAVGVVAGLLLAHPAGLLPELSSLALEVMADETIGWVILVCGLMGSLIALLMQSGATLAFSAAIAARATSRTRSLLATWALGLLIFIDDYLNALAVGNAMKGVTDRYRVSREMLAYVADSTAAPICMLVPVSTWAVFFAGVLESSGAAPSGGGLALFVRSIPYMLYPWIAVALVPLVATGAIPLLGAMQRAEAAAKTAASDPDPLAATTSDDAGTDPRARAWHFLAPLAVLLGVSWLYDIDVLVGTLAALGVTILGFGALRLVAWRSQLDGVMQGIQLMVPALTIVILAFMFKTVNDRIGMPAYVIESVAPLMTAKLLPVVTFVTMALLSFATGSSWGIFVISIPIVMPLADRIGVDPALAVGALMSASAFGSHACFYSDSTVLAAQGAGCDVMAHALTQFPYALIAALLCGGGLLALA